MVSRLEPRERGVAIRPTAPKIMSLMITSIQTVLVQPSPVTKIVTKDCFCMDTPDAKETCPANSARTPDACLNIPCFGLSNDKQQKCTSWSRTQNSRALSIWRQTKEQRDTASIMGNSDDFHHLSILQGTVRIDKRLGCITHNKKVSGYGYPGLSPQRAIEFETAGSYLPALMLVLPDQGPQEFCERRLREAGFGRMETPASL